jgi:hypothetical protein
MELFVVPSCRRLRAIVQAHPVAGGAGTLDDALEDHVDPVRDALGENAVARRLAVDDDLPSRSRPQTAMESQCTPRAANRVALGHRQR